MAAPTRPRRHRGGQEGDSDVPRPPPPRPHTLRAATMPVAMDVETLNGALQRLVDVSDKIKELMKDAQRECNAAVTQETGEAPSAANCIKSMRTSLGVVSKSLRERDAAIRSLKQYKMDPRGKPRAAGSGTKRSDAELGVLVNILKASLRALEAFAFDFAVQTKELHEEINQRDKAQEWLVKVQATESHFANRPVDEDFLADMIEEKERLQLDILKCLSKRKAALDNMVGKSVEEQVGLDPGNASVVPALFQKSQNFAPAVSPSGDTLEFIQMAKDFMETLDTLSALKLSQNSLEEADVVKKLQRDIDQYKQELHKSNMLRSKLQVSLERFAGLGERDGTAAAHKELAHKQRVRIEELDAELRHINYRNVDLEVGVARLTRETAIKEEALETLKHDLDSVRVAYAEHVETNSSRIDELHTEGLKLNQVVDQVTINLDLLGVLIAHHAEEVQELQQADKTDELRVQVQSLEAQVSQYRTKAEEKDKLAVLAMAARRQSVSQYREVKSELKTCQAKVVDLERTNQQLRKDYHAALKTMESRHDGQLTELHMQVAKNVDEISRLQSILDASSEPMSRAESLRFELLRTQALARELEAKNQDYKQELEILQASLLQGKQGELGEQEPIPTVGTS